MNAIEVGAGDSTTFWSALASESGFRDRLLQPDPPRPHMLRAVPRYLGDDARRIERIGVADQCGR